MAKINAEQKEGIFLSMLETFLTVYITSAMGLSQNIYSNVSPAYFICP